MRRNKCRYFSSYKSIFLFLVCITTCLSLFESITSGNEVYTEANDLDAFFKAVKTSDDSHAMSLGGSIFDQLEKRYRNDAGFGALKSKLTAAEFLARQMISQLKKATNERTLAVVNELFEKKKDDKGGALLVAPAKSFYETSAELFSTPVRIAQLADEEKAFLAQYYNLKLRILSSTIAKAGQALAIAEPSFKGTYDYVLVLPLLHVSNKKSINIDVLPRWMRQSEQLDIFSDSCLLHFGFPFHAMMVAKQSAEIRKSPFSELDFYRSAAKKCGVSYPHIAVNCLHKAIDCVQDKESNETIALQFEIVQLWLDSGNYALAAGEAHRILESFPNDDKSGQAIWLYYYALSRNNDTDGILADIDGAIGDSRCEAYKAKLMYIKWWALRRKRDQAARVAALEYELLKKYGNDPMVAPILLSRATDLLARQDYNLAYESLTELIDRFPSTKAAAQAKKMLVKLEKTKGM